MITSALLEKRSQWPDAARPFAQIAALSKPPAKPPVILKLFCACELPERVKKPLLHQFAKGPDHICNQTSLPELTATVRLHPKASEEHPRTDVKFQSLERGKRAINALAVESARQVILLLDDDPIYQQLTSALRPLAAVQWAVMHPARSL